MAIFFSGCSDDDLTLQFPEGIEGRITVTGYSALTDSLQIRANGELIEFNGHDTFKGEISGNYSFVYYTNAGPENIEILNKATGEVIRSYNFTSEVPVDTLSFYANNGIYIDDVLSFQPGTLSTTGRTGYRFIFPTLNRYSNSGYEGALDAIIKRTNGQIVGISENITKENFSSFVEFDFAPPPILNVELVKHGTTDSYTSQPVIVQMVMQNNRTRLIVLDEKADENGTFAGVEGTINLVDYFDF